MRSPQIGGPDPEQPDANGANRCNRKRCDARWPCQRPTSRSPCLSFHAFGEDCDSGAGKFFKGNGSARSSEQDRFAWSGDLRSVATRPIESGCRDAKTSDSIPGLSAGLDVPDGGHHVAQKPQHLLVRYGSADAQSPPDILLVNDQLS